MARQPMKKLTKRQFEAIAWVVTYARSNGIDPTCVNLRFQEKRTFNGLVKRGLAKVHDLPSTCEIIYRLTPEAEAAYWQQKNGNFRR